MADKKIDDQPEKVMDISAPGKGKIITTSRPVISSSPGTGADAARPISDMIPTQSPSTSHKIIQPITVTEPDNDEKPEEPKPAEEPKPDEPQPEAVEATPEPEIEPVVVEEKPTPVPAVGKEAVIEETVLAKDEPKLEEPTPEPTAEPQPAAEASVEPSEPVKAPEPPKDKPTEVESDSSAGVDELAKSVETKKDAAKKAEEAAQKQESIQKLIDSKQYFVPIGHASPMKGAQKKGKGSMVIILLLAVLIGAYLAADVGLFDPGFDLPFELIKN